MGPEDFVEPGVYVGGFEDDAITGIVLASAQKVVEALGMTHALSGEIYASMPGARGAVVPLVGWPRS
eukprot:7327042-Alexandrium_andersonii.AAC.1